MWLPRWGLGMRTFFFFFPSLPSPCRWVAPHIAVTRTPKNGQKFQFLCGNFMYEWMGAPSTSTRGWLRCKGFHVALFTNHNPSFPTIHISSMLCTFCTCSAQFRSIFSIIQSHYRWNWPHQTYGCMSDWPKKNFLKADWDGGRDAIPWSGKGFYEGHHVRMCADGKTQRRTDHLSIPPRK